MRGKAGNVIMIDGSPLFFKRFTEFLGHVDSSDEYIQNEILTSLVRMDFPENHQAMLTKTLSETSWDAKIDSFISFYANEQSYNKKYSREWMTALYQRFKMVQTINEASFSYLKSSRISLVVPSDKLISDINEDYNLHRYSSQAVPTLVVKGNHVSILHNSELSKFINSFK